MKNKNKITAIIIKETIQTLKEAIVTLRNLNMSTKETFHWLSKHKLQNGLCHYFFQVYDINLYDSGFFDKYLNEKNASIGGQSIGWSDELEDNIKAIQLRIDVLSEILVNKEY